MAVLKINKLTHKELFPGFIGRIACLKNMMFSHWTIEKGANLPAHHHVHEQISILIKGRFEFTLDGKSHLIEPGMVVMIPSEAIHSGIAITACEIIDVFCPVRDDYVNMMKE